MSALTPTLIVLAGGGETTYENVSELLENWLKIDVARPITASAYDYLLPIGQGYDSETVGIYADWLMDLDVKYAVVTDREVPEDLDDVVAGASHVYDVGTGNITNWVINHLREYKTDKHEAHLILSWGPDSQDAPDKSTEELLTAGLHAGLSMKDVSLGLEDFVLGEATAPTPEPEPEPAPEKPRSRSQARRQKITEEAKAEPAEPAAVVNPKPEPIPFDTLVQAELDPTAVPRPALEAARKAAEARTDHVRGLDRPHKVETKAVQVEWKTTLSTSGTITTLRRVETFLESMDSVFASEPIGKLLREVREIIDSEVRNAAQTAEPQKAEPTTAPPAVEPEEPTEGRRRGRPRKPAAEVEIGVLINEEKGTVRKAARGKPRAGERAAKMTMAEVVAQFGEQDWS